MNTNDLKLLAGIAWAAAGMSSAAPANAVARLPDAGSYAYVSPNYSNSPLFACETQWNYTQSVKVYSSACSSGTCGSWDRNIKTDFVYSGGRKTTNKLGFCGGGLYLYGLGSCNC